VGESEEREGKEGRDGRDVCLSAESELDCADSIKVDCRRLKRRDGDKIRPESRNSTSARSLELFCGSRRCSSYCHFKLEFLRQSLEFPEGDDGLVRGMKLLASIPPPAASFARLHSCSLFAHSVESVQSTSFTLLPLLLGSLFLSLLSFEFRSSFLIVPNLVSLSGFRSHLGRAIYDSLTRGL
jgi:hypothetical protein